MSTDINEIIRQKRQKRHPTDTDYIHCADGFVFSVQASRRHFCSPRVDSGTYTHVEVGYPNRHEPALEPYKDGANVYAFVPVRVVEEIIEKHGGAK